MPAFNEEINVFVKSLGPFTSKALAEAAHTVEADILNQQSARKGIEPGVETAVDGDRGKAFEDVRPDGVIFMQFDYRAEIIAVCFDELRARAPIVTGNYRDSFFVMLDGKGIDPLTIPTAEQLQNVTRIAITNPVPYARRLEVGLDENGSPFVKQTDPHIMERASLAVSRRYGSAAYIGFNYVDLDSAYILQAQGTHGFITGTTIRKPARDKDRAKGKAIRYPAIIITRGTN